MSPTCAWVSLGRYSRRSSPELAEAMSLAITPLSPQAESTAETFTSSDSRVVTLLVVA